MSKQTSVEWLVEQLTKVDYGCINKTFLQNNKSLAGRKLRELLDQAKAMEKEQIRDSFFKGFLRDLGNRDEDAERYYNETYKGGNNG